MIQYSFEAFCKHQAKLETRLNQELVEKGIEYILSDLALAIEQCPILHKKTFAYFTFSFFDTDMLTKCRFDQLSLKELQYIESYFTKMGFNIQILTDLDAFYKVRIELSW